MGKIFEDYPVLFNSKSVELSGNGSAADFSRAIEKFRHNSPAVPVDRLYTAYRSLKDMIDSMGPDFASQSSHFNDVFLRILEERGESDNGFYRSVLRDSSEFRFLSDIFIKESLPAPQREKKNIVEEVAPDDIPEKLSLKSIIAGKKNSLKDYSEDEWSMLVDDHFIDIEDEKLMVKSSAAVIARVIKRGDSLDYHITGIVEYVLIRLKGYRKIDISSKDYAMKLMNMISYKSETWNRLHREYLEIIKK